MEKVGYQTRPLHEEPVAPDAQPRCPGHLSPVAQKEWRRLASSLHKMGVLTTIDRAALAAYCQSYGRWVEAEEKLKETPALYKTPSGYVQQSPWLAIADKQLELMGRFMVELGMTPAARTQVAIVETPGANDFRPITIEFVSPCDKEPKPDPDLLVSWMPTNSEGPPS